jgi:hypothetical protein
LAFKISFDRSLRQRSGMVAAHPSLLAARGYS